MFSGDKDLETLTVTPSKTALRLADEGRCSCEHCAECGHSYTDQRDFFHRNPKSGLGDDIVCEQCWQKYLAKRT